MSKLILDAIAFCNEKHASQTRKVSGLPYASHPIAVSYIVSNFKKSKKLDELITAALLHDCIEDTDATFIEIADRFTPLVASLVLELTSDQKQINEVGKLEYHKKKFVGMSSYALVIKLADRLNNISDSPTDKMMADTLVLMAHLVENRKLSNTQQAMVNEIVRICKNGLNK